MTKNVGGADRVVRIVVALVLGVLIYMKTLEGTAAIVAGVVALYLLLTGLFGACLFYKMVGVDTSVQEQPYSSTDARAGL